MRQMIEGSQLKPNMRLKLAPHLNKQHLICYIERYLSYVTPNLNPMLHAQCIIKVCDILGIVSQFQLVVIQILAAAFKYGQLYPPGKDADSSK